MLKYVARRDEGDMNIIMITLKNNNKNYGAIYRYLTRWETLFSVA